MYSIWVQTHTTQHVRYFVGLLAAELKALAEIIGPYGIRYLGEKLMEQLSGQVKQIKKLVIANQDTLLALHTSRDKPEIFSEVLRKLKSKWPSIHMYAEE